MFYSHNILSLSLSSSVGSAKRLCRSLEFRIVFSMRDLSSLHWHRSFWSSRERACGSARTVCALPTYGLSHFIDNEHRTCTILSQTFCDRSLPSAVHYVRCTHTSPRTLDVLHNIPIFSRTDSFRVVFTCVPAFACVCVRVQRKRERESEERRKRGLRLVQQIITNTANIERSQLNFIQRSVELWLPVK